MCVHCICIWNNSLILAVSPFYTQLIPKDEIDQLLLVLFGFGGNPEDQDRWYAQGLGFVEDKSDDPMNHNNDIRFGLLQIHGGPCGVMAPIQVNY